MRESESGRGRETESERLLLFVLSASLRLFLILSGAKFIQRPFWFLMKFLRVVLGAEEPINSPVLGMPFLYLSSGADEPLMSEWESSLERNTANEDVITAARKTSEVKF